MADVVMPQLGETVTEGTVTKWLKTVGETIARDEPLFEVSTDKVDSEVPSPAAGVLAEIRVPEGDTVDVGTVLAIVSDGVAAPANGAGPTASETPAAAPPPVPAAAPAAPTPVAPTPVAPTPIPAPPPFAAPAPSVAAPAAAVSPPPPPAAAPPVSFAAATPSAAPVPAAPAAGSGVNGAGGGATLVLSPVVRRLLDENGIDPSEIRGTGLGGRITRSDVLALIDAQRAGGATAAAAPPAAVPEPPAAVAPPAPAPTPAAPTPAPAPAAAPAAVAPAPAPVAAARRRPPSPLRRRQQHPLPHPLPLPLPPSVPPWPGREPTRWCRSRTSGGGRPSTWSGRKPRHRTRWWSWKRTTRTWNE